MKKTNKKTAKPVQKPVRDTAKSDGLDSRVTEGLARLHEREKTWPKLANKIGRSTSLIQFWREGKNSITRDDAVTLALLDVKLDVDPVRRVEHWLSACGHVTDDNWVADEVSRRTNLTNRIDDSLEALIDLAASKGLSSGDFRMALSCHLGQRLMAQEFEGWKAGTNGQGTTAIFWRWDDGRAARLMEPQTVSFIKGLISPEERCRSGWSPAGIPSSLKVLLFFQINEDEGEWERAEALLRKTIKNIRTELKLEEPDTKRLLVYTTKKRFAHPADLFVFVSPGNSLGVLASDLTKLMRKVLNSQADEMRSRPWDWCCQVIQVDKETIINRDCLKPKGVILNTDTAQLEVEPGVDPDARAWKVLEVE